MASAEVNDKCIRLYAKIAAYMCQMGHAPTVRDMGKMMGITSTSMMAYYVKTLVKWGWITKAEGKGRTIVLTRPTEAGRTLADIAPYFADVEVSAPKLEARTMRTPIRHIERRIEQPPLHRREVLRAQIEPYKGGG
jgi:SOS-response transcriptional repressor LexA